MRLMVVSPHPDDETLGAGGTILKYKAQGYTVGWLNFTDMNEAYGYPSAKVKERTREIEVVRGQYQFDHFYNLGLKPAGLDEYQTTDLISRVSKIMGEFEPEMVILPFKNDIHSDHRVVFEAVYSCTKVFRYPFIRKILMMEIVSETDFAPFECGFVPNYFIDITDYLDRKIKIMAIYQGEMKAAPFPRNEENVKALALFRGATAGCNHAEGFILLKGIE